MIQTIFGLMALVASEPSSCIDDRDTLLALDQQAFDQDINGGWRAVAKKEGCDEAAADLIADYRSLHDLKEETILWWHEGQLRAGIGQTDEAIELFENSYKEAASLFDEAWNFYVAATIAFLQRDYDALIAARDGLFALPAPEGYEQDDPALDEFEAKYGFRPVWPQNGPVVESLVRCFDKPYSEAYSRSCGLEENTSD